MYPKRQEEKSQMNLDFMTWAGMYMNGAWTGTIKKFLLPETSIPI